MFFFKRETLNAFICLFGWSTSLTINKKDFQQKMQEIYLLSEIITFNYSIRLPRVKLVFARQSFYFYGGKLCNELAIGI